ncbi:TonB-dependent receptor [Alteriqipengyuania lutimaris]|uniref:TonB-dependent siderophore receptor n=1 Tax=Alteriqipengyuania lutimaris TaxID=1538146 RepID=A0A395LNY4_9SPHN|nr:TonB-dependent siderophore receptor [Alteriqipengyuania lutimaris]MBB3032419.1 catecholate siderophore receptor [Alteriqipengyuania lutimaris]RDS78435.1 TonB-dependent siderophore receptor [Alteriqipengyuania lutimaris]
MKRTIAARPATYLALGCVGFIASAPALAEEGELEAGAQPNSSIIVSGERADELEIDESTASILDTPRIVNVVTEETLEQTASYSFEEALRTVPGITLGAGEGGTAAADIPLIRGVDATGDVFVDGARDIGSQTRETFAVEQIEVFKGPSGALGGRGAAAGGINIVSKTARAGDFVSATGTIGTSDLYRVTADINQQIGDQLAVRLVGLFHDSNQPGRDEVFDDRWGVSPSIAFGVGGDTVVSLTHYHFEGDQLPDYGIPLTSRNQLPGGERVPADVDFDNFYGLLARDFQKSRTDTTTFKFDHDMRNGWSASALLRYSDSDMDYIVTNPDDSAGNVANGLVWRAIKSRNSNTEAMTANANLSGEFATGSVLHSLSFGAEYAWADTYNLNYNVDTGNRTCPPEDIANFNCTDLPNPDPSDPWDGSITRSDTPSLSDAEDLSVYLFDSITLVPQLIVSGGVRYTDYRASGSGSGRGGPFNAEVQTDFVTWQAGATFKPVPSVSLYASYADAKNPPGTDVGAGSANPSIRNETYSPQETENYEIGAKAELFGGAMQVSAAAFQVDRGNIINTDALGEVTDVFDAARIRGFEIGVTGRAGPVSLFGGYTYVDSEIREDTVSGNDDPTDDGDSNVGNTLPNTPKHNLSLSGTVEFDERFSVGGGVYYQSERFADGGNLISADGYVRADLFAAFAITDTLGLRLNVKNVGDERYVTKLRNPHFAVPANARQAVLSVAYRY